MLNKATMLLCSGSLQNLALSSADNEEVCYCLQAWQELPASIKSGLHPSKDEALKVCSAPHRPSIASIWSRGSVEGAGLHPSKHEALKACLQQYRAAHNSVQAAMAPGQDDCWSLR